MAMMHMLSRCINITPPSYPLLVPTSRDKRSGAVELYKNASHT